MNQQRVSTLGSYRVIWQTVLHKELCLLAALQNECFTNKQIRVDGCILHASRKGQKMLLEMKEEAWCHGTKLQSKEA